MYRVGAASSSCTYPAVALAQSTFRKGADVSRRLTPVPSTNLVIELGITRAVLIGWQFVDAEFVGA